jgi:hypothetical protein
VTPGQYGISLITKDPDLGRARLLVEYLREVSDEFVFAIDDRTAPSKVKELTSWPGVKHRLITWQHDFAWARNQSIEMVEAKWTIYFDIDELPSWELIKWLKERDDTEPSPLGYLLWFQNFYGGVGGPGYEWDWHLRMFRTGMAEFYRPVHELVRLRGKEETMTRGNDGYVRKAPVSAYVIHSKPEDKLSEDSVIYENIAQKSGIVIDS